MNMSAHGASALSTSELVAPQPHVQGASGAALAQPRAALRCYYFGKPGGNTLVFDSYPVL